LPSAWAISACRALPRSRTSASLDARFSASKVSRPAKRFGPSRRSATWVEGVELGHGDRTALAVGFANAGGGGTGVIAMHLAAFRSSSSQGHRPAARSAERQIGEQDRTGHDARRQDARIVGGQTRLNLVEDIPFMIAGTATSMTSFSGLARPVLASRWLKRQRPM
jgi:hypothetical protein